MNSGATVGSTSLGTFLVTRGILANEGAFRCPLELLTPSYPLARAIDYANLSYTSVCPPSEGQGAALRPRLCSLVVRSGALSGLPRKGFLNRRRLPSNRRRLPSKVPSVTLQTAVGYPPTPVGCHPKCRRLPSKPPSVTLQTAVGYPPTAVG